MIRPTRRGVIAGGLAAALAPARAGAGTGGLLRVRAVSDLQILDPARQVTGGDQMALRCLAVSLLRNNEIGPSLDGVTPYAARVFEQVSPTAYRFELHDWLVWSNGFGPVTAADVAFTLERIADPATGSAYAYPLAALDHVEITGERSGTIHLTKPYTPLAATALAAYGGFIVCRAATEQADPADILLPATCGPYRVEEWVQRQHLTVVRNPDWRGALAFERIRLEFIADDNAAALAFAGRAIDYTELGNDALALYRRRPPRGARLQELPGPLAVFVSINMRNPRLADARIRRAIQAAIDPAEIVAGAYSGPAPVAVGPIPPAMLGARARVLQPPDPKLARTLLAEAGIVDLRIELAVSNDQPSVLTAQIMRQQLARVVSIW